MDRSPIASGWSRACARCSRCTGERRADDLHAPRHAAGGADGHAWDLGFIPVVITDASGAGDAEAGARALETLEFLGDALLTDAAGFREALADS